MSVAVELTHALTAVFRDMKAPGARERCPLIHPIEGSAVVDVISRSGDEEVARVASLVMHTRRKLLSAAIRENMQQQLDRSDPAVFRVTRVMVRSVLTDASIEESIRPAMSNQKKLGAMQVQTEIAKQEARY